LKNVSSDTPFPAGTGARIASMDQFRGFAILALIFVNHVGDFDSMPWMLHHHHEGMAINDVVAPMFLFMVGMGFRLSFLRRIEKEGLAQARWAAAGRYLFLTILGAAIYQGYWWDALTDIGLGGLIALCVIERSAAVRVGAAFAYLALFQTAFTRTGYGAWVMEHSLNGGPLGPLSWSFPLLMGSVAYDMMATKNLERIVRGCLTWGLALSAAGWALTFPWPGIKAAWPFTAYGMSALYPLYATGLCFLLLLGFVLLCDHFRLRVPHLSVLGVNPLVLYVTQLVVIEVGHLPIPRDASVAMVLLTFVPLYLIHYLLAWFLQRKHIIIKI
jgi:predicted acyltransferase